MNVWYLYDGTLRGAHALDDLKRVMDAQWVYGLELNLAKCEAYVFNGPANEIELTRDQLKTVALEIRFLTEDNVSFLGLPSPRKQFHVLSQQFCVF